MYLLLCGEEIGGCRTTDTILLLMGFYYLFFVAVSGRIEMDYPNLVNGSVGKDLIIPCSFSVIDDQLTGEATVVWWKSMAYTGPVIYQCSNNCSKSDGRYSFAGNITEKNISLKISMVSFTDTGIYFCRIERSDKFTSQGIVLQVKVPKELRRIYVQTTEQGERWVTCEVFGDPPPNVIWTQPNTVNPSEILNQHGIYSSSSSVPASPNTNYTCQIDLEKQKVALSIYNQESGTLAAACNERVYITVIVVLAVTLGIVLLYLLCVLVNLFKRGHNKPSENNDNVYHNYPRLPDLDGIYMNERKVETKTSK
ncbi:sialic acid-binding Ig-like lectin 15 [Astyanax mexicanus]|uniref:Sialic acid-binding Ig-like lectin 15 n=1 Tax=Astyanax mexicanus TaxID=7994 RepID=A0A8T2KRK8_ASTMX|nr:sialic acid-binding Ig-like lectin 15 [Astyanax mexicanus]